MSRLNRLLFALLVGVCSCAQAQSEALKESAVPSPPAGKTRHAKPFFKGVELYSWRAGDEWRFSLLIGTNRVKFEREIKSPAATLANLADLKKKLAQLAPGEQVSWSGPGMLPQAVRIEIETACRSFTLKCHTGP